MCWTTNNSNESLKNLFNSTNKSNNDTIELEKIVAYMAKWWKMKKEMVPMTFGFMNKED